MSKIPYRCIITLLLTITLFPTYMNVRASTMNKTEETISEPDIAARSAVVLDAETQAVLYSKNKDQEMYPASITKILSALMTIEKFSPEDTITFSEAAVKDGKYNSSSIGARVGEIFTVDQTLHGLLLMSANEAARAIAEAYSGDVETFADAMNQRAIELGAVNSHFVNPSGLYNENHYSTAYDMALITNEAIKSNYFLEIMSHSTYEIPPTNKCDESRYLAQKHKMLNDKSDMTLFREDVIAGKTGYITEAGHTMITVADNNDRKVIVVIMETDANNWYPDTEKLIEYGFVVPMPVVVDDEPIDKKTHESGFVKMMPDQNPMQVMAAEEIKSSESNESALPSKGKGGLIFLCILLLVLGSAIVLYLDQRRSRLKRIERSMRKK